MGMREVNNATREGDEAKSGNKGAGNNPMDNCQSIIHVSTPTKHSDSIKKQLINQKYYQLNKKRILRAYHDNPSPAKRQMQANYHANRSSIRLSKREAYAANPSPMKRRKREAYAANPSPTKQRMKANPSPTKQRMRRLITSIPLP